MRNKYFGSNDESLISTFSMLLCYILFTSIKRITVKFAEFLHKFRGNVEIM